MATEEPPNILYKPLLTKIAALTPLMSLGNLPLPQILPMVCTGVKYIPPFNYIPPKNTRLSKEKRDKLPILYNGTDTTDIRNLAAWLNEQADEIDREKEIIKSNNK